MLNIQQKEIQNEIERIRKEINLLQDRLKKNEKKKQRMFQNELKNVEKRRNKLKQIVKKRFFLGQKKHKLCRGI